MRWKVVIGNLGSILKLFGLAFFIPVIPALYYQESPILFGFLPYNALVFIFLAFFTITLGYPAEKFTRSEDFYHNEGIVLVSFTWLVLALISSLPFLMTYTLSSPIDAFFEAMAGITTTGATVLTFPLEAHPKSILLWRAVMQWLGGMGVIVLSVAILSKLSRGGLSLLEAESPGPEITRLKPKIKETAKSIWYLYGLFTLILIILLVGARVSLYDAVYHSLTTMPTGGFSPHTNSIAYFSSTVQWIFIFFMIIAGVNTSLQYQAFGGKLKKLFTDPEFKAYIAIIISGATIVIFFGMSQDISIRDALFQTVSILTTTGYTTQNFDKWPETLRLLLLLFMFVGGSAGSTSGGIKVLRILLMFKLIKRRLIEYANPKRVLVVWMGDSVIDERTLETVAIFFGAYLLIFVIGALVMVGLGLDLVSGIAASASSLGNIGPGLGLISNASFESVPTAGKLFLAIIMWIGRLEIFTAIVLFNPSLYKKRRLRNLLDFDLSGKI